jgi:hypothetical protein
MIAQIVARRCCYSHSVHLARVQRGAGIAEAHMDQILRSHVIEPSLLRVAYRETDERCSRCQGPPRG